jgi:hypothetical protein
MLAMRGRERGYEPTGISSPIPVQNLDPSAITVRKNKQIPSERVQLHLPFNNGGKTIDPFPEIYGLSVKVNRVKIVRPKHYSPPPSHFTHQLYNPLRLGMAR